MREAGEDRKRLSGATATDIQTVRSELVDKGLLYLAVVIPLALSFSLARIFEHGWLPVYYFHIGATGLVITGAVLRRRLPYRARAGLLLGILLVLGVTNLPAFGLVGGGILMLLVFACLTAVAFGTRMGLIACVIDLGMVALAGVAVRMGVVTFSFDIGEYATSITAWSVMTVAFFMFAPMTVVAFGVVHEHLAASIQDLRESHAKHARLVDNLVESFLYRHDVKGDFNYASSSVRHVLGYSTREFLTHFSEYLTDHPVNQEVVKHTEQSINGVQQPPYEMQIFHKDGSVRWLEVSETPVRDRDGRVVAVEGVAHDITERKRAQDVLAARTVELEQRTIDLEKSRQAAEAANQSKSEFLANMSHEIRTPMTAILGFADVLLEHGSIKEAPLERIEAAQTIKKNGEYLIGIINDILDLSKIEAGKMGVKQITCNPCKLIAEVASLLKVKADGKNLSFNIEYSGAVPETIQTDPTRLRQVLINLVANAIKFTEVGSVRLIARFVEDKDKPAMQFDVADSGIGMAKSQLAKLFQPFTQADASATRKFGGTGLGLSISKRFAVMMGGDIAVVYTQEGIGTRFRFTVPTGPLDEVKMVHDPMSATVVGTEDAAESADQAALQGCRILLAEDGPDNQRLISFMLKQVGAEVTSVENGKLAVDTALAALNGRREDDPEQPFDIILMDMQMPVMDGYEATGLLRQVGYTGPIIALTAHAMEGDRKKCINAGCDAYETKPVNRVTFIETIRQHLVSAEAATAAAT